MPKYSALEILHRLRLPITRENYIKVQYWDLEDEIPSLWSPELEAKLPKDLQDWTIFEKSIIPTQSGNI